MNISFAPCNYYITNRIKECLSISTCDCVCVIGYLFYRVGFLKNQIIINNMEIKIEIFKIKIADTIFG